MEFLLSQMPAPQLVECASKHTSFIAELFEPRPDWKTILAYRETMAKLQTSVEKLATRESCPFAELGIYIDHQGACLLATAKVEMQLCNARSAISTLLQPLDLYEDSTSVKSRKRMEKTIRPFDALDKVRVDAWKTVAQLRPPCPKLLKPERTTPPPTTVKEFLAAATDSGSEDDDPPLLAIGHGIYGIVELL